MRLTEKDKDNYKIVNELETEKGKIITTQLLANYKLGQLEDIEEELGIDLYKLISNQCFYRFEWDDDKESFVKEDLENWFIDVANKRLIKIKYFQKDSRTNASIIYKDFETIYFKDYGNKGLETDWALTKEELK